MILAGEKCLFILFTQYKKKILPCSSDMVIMLKSLEKLQNGLLPYISFRKSVATTRVSELALSPFTTFETAHTSIVTSMDIHRKEDR
ncbi:hypothetical protein CEXT_403291 [Caerostris extrusa]|uniref:Uncharacterized protein n=1 Tax=Caerostris extrusa TaxID=172846 RepID=A0AAV4XLK0_CAEEX|nr:hypothetical protein CEXT_403291 [Caerostris extrusa]